MSTFIIYLRASAECRARVINPLEDLSLSGIATEYSGMQSRPMQCHGIVSYAHARNLNEYRQLINNLLIS